MVCLRVVVLLVTLALDVLAYVYLARFRLVTYIVMGVVTVVGVFFASVYVPLYFRMLVFRVSRDVLSKESGFFIKSTQTMRVSSVQYVTSVDVPLFRRVGFNFIVFNALGGRMVFNFLSKQDSVDVLEYVDARISGAETR